MILFGHIGITVFLGNLLSLALLYVFMGSVSPDLIDKPLQISGLVGSGRFIGHTLFMGLVIAGIIHLITRKKLFSLSFLFGYFVHLLEDASHFVPWFYPFVNYSFPSYSFGPVFSTFNIISEIIGVILLVQLIHSKSHFKGFLVKSWKGLRDKFKKHWE